MIHRLLSPIAIRLLLFNILLVFLPVAGLFSLRSLEQELLDLQERSMVQQARMVAAALSAETEHLNAGTAHSLIQRLGRQSEARIRIMDRSGTVLADSAAMHPSSMGSDEARAPADPVARKRPLYRIGAALWRAFRAVREFAARPWKSPPSSEAPADATPHDVVRRALGGRYGATLQESSGQRSLTLYSVLPIRAAGRGEVIGAVMVSQSTSRILRALWRVRLDTFEVFVISLAVAAVLSLLMSATIARPLIRLRNEADDLLDHRGRLRGTFRGSRRKDEIGDLTRALEKLTERLERHLAFVESFSADVSHEFKNPLASIRNAAELLVQADDEDEQQQLGATIEKEVVHLTNLLNAVREVSKVDAALATEPAKRVDLGSLLSELSEARRANHVRIHVTAPAPPLVVAASEERVFQAFANILANAISFSPPQGRVSISLHETNGHALVRVDDEGPGIPPEHLERIFDRFFSFRPGAAETHDHAGLGLAIARAIVDGYGGSIRASNLAPRGARIEVSLPMARS